MLYPHVREARFHEIPQIARLNSLAFWDDELIGERMHPSREEYPNDFDLHWLRMARPHYFDPRWRFIVAVVKDETGKEVIAGCGQWSRMGEGGKGMEYGWFDPRKSATLTLDTHTYTTRFQSARLTVIPLAYNQDDTPVRSWQQP